jgi:mRNA-degrading endonuclease RelE of RelBE toxin-antitoxin system
VYVIRFAVSVVRDLKRVSPYHRNIILDAIEAQLSHEPTSPAKHRKLLINLVPPWDAVPPVWELRVGEFRVFYDVAEAEQIVDVRAIRKKPPGKRTEEIL